MVALLNHACKVVQVVRSGRSFLRRMLDLLHAVSSTQPFIRLNINIKIINSSMPWFLVRRKYDQVDKHNQFSLRPRLVECIHKPVEWDFLPPPSHLPEAVITTDASWSWECGGCGAWHVYSWFMGHTIPPSLYSREGTDSYHPGLCCMG